MMTYTFELSGERRVDGDDEIDPKSIRSIDAKSEVMAG
jgi:hypothetical protein